MVVISGLGSLPEPHMGQDAHPWLYIQLGLPSWVLNQVRNCHPGFYNGQRIVILVLISGKTCHPGPYIGHRTHTLYIIWNCHPGPYIWYMTYMTWALYAAYDVILDHIPGKYQLRALHRAGRQSLTLYPA